MKRKSIVLGSCMLMLTAALAGCGGKANDPGSGSAGSSPAAGTSGAQKAVVSGYNNEPVKLTVYDYQAGFNERQLETHIIKPIQAKYPNISFELMKASSPEQLAASGSIPDLVITSNVYVKMLLDLKLGEDMQARVKTGNFNVNGVEPEVMNEIKKFGPKGEIYALPISMNYGVMLYNKDIFDKFGVPYPKDEMTWSQTLDLAKKVTRQDGGTQYIGVSMGAPQGLLRQYSLPVVDEKQEKSTVTGEGFRTIFKHLRELYDMNGFLGPNKEFSYGFNEFAKTQTLAMNPNWIAAVTDSLSQLQADGKPLNWDMVSYPAFDDRPKLGRQVDFHLFMVPSVSKNKDAAYEVIKMLLTNEAQASMNKAGRLTVLKDSSLRKEYAKNLKVYEGKNLAGIFKVSPAPAPMSTDYDTKIYGFLQESNRDMAQKNVDVNTALRVAEEKANKYIQEVKASK